MLSLRQRIRDVVASAVKFSGHFRRRDRSPSPECQALLREMALGRPNTSQWNELLAFRDRRFREAYREDLVTPARTREESWSLSESGLVHISFTPKPLEIKVFGEPSEGLRS
jgi:hypothetical protein